MQDKYPITFKRRRLLSRLRHLDMTQAQFALYLGTTPQTITHWGKDRPIPDYALNFLEVLETARIAKENLFLTLWRYEQIKKCIKLSPEAFKAAMWQVRHGYDGSLSSPLPPNITEKVVKEIQRKRDWFKLAVVVGQLLG